jgi:hypothetical protein
VDEDKDKEVDKDKDKDERQQRQRQRTTKRKTVTKITSMTIYSRMKFSSASECVITTHSDTEESAGQKVTVVMVVASTFHR